MALQTSFFCEETSTINELMCYSSASRHELLNCGCLAQRIAQYNILSETWSLRVGQNRKQLLVCQSKYQSILVKIEMLGTNSFTYEYSNTCITLEEENVITLHNLCFPTEYIQSV